MSRIKSPFGIKAALVATLVFAGLTNGGTAYAAEDSDFSLQVTPSPLVTNVKPGQTNEVEFKVRNAGSQAETLKIVPRSFRFNSSNQQLQLDDTTPPDIAQWIAFSEPTFTVQPGQWYTQKLKLSPPKDAGFSYSFALVISRKDAPEATEAGRLLKGSLALFTLVNVDRPGAVRKLEVSNFSSTKKLYEFLPASFKIRLKNSGNTLVQPYGNIYIQRNSNDTTPISTIPVNDKKSYILPGTERVLESSWGAGFPKYDAEIQPDGGQKQKLSSNWATADTFRFGRYTAKLVAAYNDGQRDVPVVSEVSFWVVPWKAIFGLIITAAALWYLINLRIKRKTEKAVKKALSEHNKVA